MTLEMLRQRCLDLPGVSEGFPFGPEALVMKVGSKLFAIISLPPAELKISLKNDPFVNQDLRDRYSAVQPGYHLNKRHWNTIYVDGTVPDGELGEWIKQSYELVYTSLSQAEKEQIRR